MTNTNLDLKEMGLNVLSTAETIAYQGGDAGAAANMPTMTYNGSMAQSIVNGARPVINFIAGFLGL